jgi:uncharacterized protein
MKIVALEEHFLMPTVREAWSRLDPEFRDPTTTRVSPAELENKLEDLAELRLQQMDESGVDVQVLSLTTPAVQGLDPEPAVELARQANDLIGETVRRWPDRFEGFATLPTPNPDAAARELERAIATLGCKGALMQHGMGESFIALAETYFMLTPRSFQRKSKVLLKALNHL